MTTTAMGRRERLAMLAMLGTLATGFSVSGCGRGLFGISNAEHQDASRPEVDPNPVPAGISVCFPDHPASCDDTCREATRVLWHNCAACHAQGPASVGAPVFDFVLDVTKLTTLTWLRADGVWRFLVPGSPQDSQIYVRPVVNRDMPPLSNDVSVPARARVSASDGQILQDWITGCLGTDHFDGFYTHASSQGGPGNLVACPASSSPRGACPIDGQECPYPSGSCVCVAGSWECLGCPTQQPGSGSDCAATPTASTGQQPAYRCGYGTVSCTCRALDLASGWQCGACPASRPTPGGACGNSRFSCTYGGDTCECNSNAWSCTTSACPLPPATGPFSCQPGTACIYPDQGQACSCRSYGGWSCSCPVSLPSEHNACLGYSGGACVYGEQSCTCGGTNGWHCLAACPPAAPASGATCSSTLSCTYGGQLCSCDGTRWSCS